MYIHDSRFVILRCDLVRGAQCGCVVLCAYAFYAHLSREWVSVNLPNTQRRLSDASWRLFICVVCCAEQKRQHIHDS